MKAKQTQVKKYSSTQIKMLVERMVRDAEQQVDKLLRVKTAEVDERNTARLADALKALPAAQAKAIIDCSRNEAFRRAFKLESNEGNSTWALRSKIAALGEDFKFKLTMAEHTDHEKHMKEFAAAVAKMVK